MEIEVKIVKLTKSKINQMDYIGIPKNPDVEVLGWINLDKKRYVIIKSNNCYYRASYITEVIKDERGVQFPLSNGGYEFPTLTNIICKTYNGGISNLSPYRDDTKNLELYDHIESYKRKTEIAGQIYY
jgi:hypothetical protein